LTQTNGTEGSLSKLYFYAQRGTQFGLCNGHLFWPSGTFSLDPTARQFSRLPGAMPILADASPSGPYSPPQPDGDGGNTNLDSIPGGYAVSKNVLSVGAVNNQNVRATFSSAGPTDDGRIKPDVVAIGEDVLVSSTSNGNTFAYNSGTSFAAPSVAGGVALLAELREKRGTLLEALRASTYRALVIHSATDLGIAGPDYQYGFGAFNLAAAAGPIQQDNYTSRPFIKELTITNGSYSDFNIKATGGQPVRITIAWSDPAGIAQPSGVIDPAGSRLRNNIDLRVYRTVGGVPVAFLPWRLNPASPLTPATTGPNDIDNVEQVIVNPMPALTPGEVLRVTVAPKAGTTLFNGLGQTVSAIFSGNQVLPSNFSSGSFTITSVGSPSWNIDATWNSNPGSFYRLQWRTVDYYGNKGSWQSGVVLNAVKSVTSYTEYDVDAGSEDFTLEARIIEVAPNPFND
jgi:Subtilase family